MLPIQLMELLRTTGALLTKDHLVLKSGKHSDTYINKDALYPYTRVLTSICDDFALHFGEDSHVNVVAGPEKGGILLASHTANRLTRDSGREVLAVYAEKADAINGFVFRRGYDKLLKGKDVLVTEDILSTGESAKKTVEAVRVCGGFVVGVAAVVNRGRVTVADVGDVPRLDSLLEIDLPFWDEGACPLCKEGRPINTEVGHGREFLERQKRRSVPPPT